MVLFAAIKALGDLGFNKNNETVATITWVVSRFDNTKPDNLVAFATIDAFDKIAKKNNGINDPAAINLLLRIARGPYIKPVQERANQLLADLRSYSGDKK
jgi:hypothetical protein